MNLSGLRILRSASGRGKTVAAFSKIAFAEVEELAYRHVPGLWWHSKPEPITRQVVLQRNIAGQDELVALVTESEEAVALHWESVRAGLVNLIDKAALDVINQRLRRFLPADLERALKHRTLRRHRVPRGSFAVLVDLSGSSTAMARERIESYWEKLDKFYANIYQLVLEHGGWIESFLGDGLLAHFGTYATVEGDLNKGSSMTNTFRKGLIPFLKHASRLATPRETKGVRFIATYLPQMRSYTTLVGNIESRMSLATLSDHINTCAHIERDVLRERFFGRARVRIALLIPKDSPIKKIALKELKKIGSVRRLETERTRELLRDEPVQEADLYLIKPG